MIKTKKHKPVEIFPKLYDIQPFLVDEHPKYHPHSEAYANYWEDQERKCIEGLWGLDKKGDKGGWRYMPGTLYYSSNMCVVFDDEDDDDESVNTNDPIRPLLRDIDWVMDYGYMIARGFSGFEYDEKFTCHKSIKALEEKGLKNISPKDKIFLEKFENILRKPNGDFKKYMDPVQYLYETKPEKLGRALWRNTALNYLMMGPRGYGKSWKVVYIMSYEFRVCGLRFYNDKAKYELPPIELMIMSTDTDKTADTLKKFKQLEKHLKYLGSWGKGENFIPGFWYLNTLGTLENNNMNRPYRHEYKSKEGAMWNNETGTGAAIYNKVATKQNPDVGAGPRPLLIIHEEIGLAENESQISSTNENSLKKKNKFGTEWGIGTGGNFKKIGDVKKKFLNPTANKLVEYPDLFLNRGKPIGLFIPKTHVESTFKDENGNTDVELALDQELYERKQLEEAGDIDKLQKHIVYNCLNYEEMLGGTTVNIFPTVEISDRISELEINRDKYEKDYFYGRINYNKFLYKVDFEVNNSIRGKYFENPYEDDNKTNLDNVLLFQRPIRHDGSNGYFLNPYKITFDPIKDDFSGPSYASIIVYKGFAKGMRIDEYSDNIVGTYFGRPEKVETTYEIAIQLAILYDCKILFENNIYDFAKWCDRKGYWEFLQPTPWLAIHKKIQKPSKKYNVGVNIQGDLKNYTIRLLKDLSKKKVSYEGQTMKWIERVRFLRLLYEMNLYGELNNYDALSAAQILALWLDQEEDPLIHQYVKTQKGKKNKFHESLVANLNEPNIYTNEY